MAETIFIDANIFLEIFLKNSKAEKCKEFLQSLQKENKIGLTTDFIIYTCLIQIANNTDDIELMKNFVIFLNSFSNIKVLRPSIDDVYTAIEFIDKKDLDFDDALVLSCMLNREVVSLASFDKHFDKIKDIEKVEI